MANDYFQNNLKGFFMQKIMLKSKNIRRKLNKVVCKLLVPGGYKII